MSKRDSDDGDDYFSWQTKNRVASSSKTFVPAQRLSQNEIRKELCNLDKSYEASIISRLQEECFASWHCQLRCGFNLILYGLGSKRELLQSFAETISDGEFYQINGMNAKVDLSALLVTMTQRPNLPVLDQCTELENILKRRQTRVYFIINHLDGVGLRSPLSQTVVARLGRVNKIHVIASVDHINSPLLVDSSGEWIWHLVSSYCFLMSFSSFPSPPTPSRHLISVVSSYCSLMPFSSIPLLPLLLVI
eukprot:TRINITY_DN1098_c0_g1_i11.p1 TRINITY_DN1098_c0_g1~~TRINITY_DN1098_c0_g1_i11.p1  ORF type:complete len:249 (+),score=35.85 TRINITY_DN1098_c0_g1_i11:74-820(+)